MTPSCGGYFRDDMPFTECVLRILTGDPNLHLVHAETQKDLISLAGARGLCLDVYAVDDQNQLYNLEIQRSNSGAIPERARYHASAIDVSNLRTTQNFKEIPSIFLFFITEHDIFGAGKPVYRIVRINERTKEIFDDRQYILYINASYQGDDTLGMLMHDFLCADPDEMKLPFMAEKCRSLKSSSKEVPEMCRVMDKLREESIEIGREQGREEGIEQGIEKGIQKGRETTTVDCIKKIMESLRCTEKQAMEILQIPAANQGKYMAMLN